MANYYNMQEVMDKLRKTEQEVQGLVKQGQLRQYLDSGKAVFKVEDVDNLAEEIVGLDISSTGISLEEGSELDLQLEETGEIRLQPDEGDNKPKKNDDLDLDLDLEKPGKPKSEGGFGLSQMGDLSMADTNIGTVGINILSGTDDAYKLTEDTKAETQAAEIQMEEASADEIESLDADSNLESFGSGSGLLDLSLQADDTSLGAVLDDILPAGAEGAPMGEADQGGIGLMDEDENLIANQAEPERAAAGLAAEPMSPVMSSAVMMPAGGQMVAVIPVDPKTNIFGVAMFLPMAALMIAAVVMTGAIQGVVPSFLTTLLDTKIAGLSLIWVIVAGLTVLMLLILLFSAMMGGNGVPKTAAVKKEKSTKPAKPAKPAKKGK